jgi:hypothetical protein
MKKLSTYVIAILVTLGLAVAGSIWAAGELRVNNGGTGIGSVSNGGIPYGSSTNASLNVLPIGTAGYILQSDGTKPVYVATSTLGINAGVWGQITGTLSSQTDLQNALNAKLSTTTAANTYQPLLTLPLAVNQGGTGTTTPGLIQGANITITGTWPFQTITGSAGGSGNSAWTIGNGLNLQRHFHGLSWHRDSHSDHNFVRPGQRRHESVHHRFVHGDSSC